MIGKRLATVATAGIFLACTTGLAVGAPAAAATTCTTTTPTSVLGQPGTVTCVPTPTPKKRVCLKKKKRLGITRCVKYGYV